VQEACNNGPSGALYDVVALIFPASIKKKNNKENVDSNVQDRFKP
jgi:hypothetical protein